MRYVKIFDNIAKQITRDGVAELGEGYKKTDDVNQADAILVRASDIRDLDFGPNVRCVSRSGAGYNNIPIERCAKQGIVVFNTPGGNSNALFIAALMFLRIKVPYSCSNDFRYIAPVVLSFIPFVAMGVNVEGGSLKWKVLGYALVAGFVLSTVILYILAM